MIEHFLANLNHFVAHVLNLRHSLQKKTKEIRGHVHALLYHSPLDVKSSAGTKDLHHHDLARDKTPVEGRGMNIPCTSASGFKQALMDSVSYRVCS